MGGASANAGGYQPAGRTSVGNRLPTAPRERKPALAALAVLLILAGALATMVLVNRSGNRVSVVEMTHTVAAGTRIQAGDMTEAQVAADDSIHYVLFSQAGQVAGSYAATTLVAGSLLVTEMLGSAQQQALKPGQAMIGYLFKQGQFPAGQLRPGDTVELWQTNGSPAAGSAATAGAGAGAGASTAAPGFPTKPLCQAAILAIPQNGDTLNLTLSVPEGMVGELEALAGNVSVAKAANGNG